MSQDAVRVLIEIAQALPGPAEYSPIPARAKNLPKDNRCCSARPGRQPQPTGSNIDHYIVNNHPLWDDI